jgi:hypothetical protein
LRVSFAFSGIVVGAFSMELLYAKHVIDFS